MSSETERDRNGWSPNGRSVVRCRSSPRRMFVTTHMKSCLSTIRCRCSSESDTTQCDTFPLWCIVSIPVARERFFLLQSDVANGSHSDSSESLLREHPTTLSSALVDTSTWSFRIVSPSSFSASSTRETNACDVSLDPRNMRDNRSSRTCRCPCDFRFRLRDATFQSYWRRKLVFTSSERSIHPLSILSVA